MGKEKTKGRYRVLAIVWSFAAISMVAGVLRQMPNVSAMSLVILVLSVSAAAIWWSAYLKAAKADNPKKNSEEKKHG